MKRYYKINMIKQLTIKSINKKKYHKFNFNMSQKRLQIEIQDFSNNPPENYEEGPVNENDLNK